MLPTKAKNGQTREAQTNLILLTNNNDDIPTGELTSIRGASGPPGGGEVIIEGGGPSRNGTPYDGGQYLNNLAQVMVGEVHGHDKHESTSSNTVNYGTHGQETTITTTTNATGPSIGRDARVSAERGLPIYTIDSYTGSANPNIGRAAGGTAVSNVTTLGNGNFNIGVDALKEYAGIP